MDECRLTRCEYTQDAIVQMVRRAIESDLDRLYRVASSYDSVTGNPGWIDFSSKTNDGAPCMDVAAEQLLLQPDKLRMMGRGGRPREKSYCVGHLGCANTTAREKRHRRLKYCEKLVVRAMFNCPEQLPFGQMVDYELPLQEEEDATYGAVDLVAVHETALKLIEVKSTRGKARTGDSLLHALLEVYTYYNAMMRTPHATKERLTSDFPILAGHAPEEYHFEPVVLVERESRAGIQLRCIGDYPRFRQLVHWIEDALQEPLRFYVFDYPAKDSPEGDAFRRDECGRIVLVGPLTIQQCPVT